MKSYSNDLPNITPEEKTRQSDSIRSLEAARDALLENLDQVYQELGKLHTTIQRIKWLLGVTFFLTSGIIVYIFQ